MNAHMGRGSRVNRDDVTHFEEAIASIENQIRDYNRNSKTNTGRLRLLQQKISLKQELADRIPATQEAARAAEERLLEKKSQLHQLEEQKKALNDRVTEQVKREQALGAFRQKRQQLAESEKELEKYQTFFAKGIPSPEAMEEVTDADHQLAVREKELEELEQGVNAVIRQNLPIREIYLEGEEENTISERKEGNISFRQKKALEGDIRIIEIPKVDSCACCGTHVSFTGEIGVFTILSYEKHRKGCRLTMLAGELAFLALEKKLKLLSGFAQSLSRPWTEIPEAFRSLQEKIFEKEEEKRGILEAGIRLLEEKILKELEEQRKGIEDGEKLERRGETESRGESGQGAKTLLLGSPLKDSCFSYYGKKPYLFLYLSELGMKDLQKICDRLRLSLPLSLICLGKKEEGFSLVAGSREEDMRVFGKLLGEKLSFRGGGQKEMIQGSTGVGFREMNAFIERIL
mgnify:CR=1 FL=1